jgi:hypothetical protein
MKKLLTLFLFTAMAQLVLAQLDVKVREQGDELVVVFPAGKTFEYKINMVDPIAQGLVEMQFSKVGAGPAPAEVKWYSVEGMNYQLAYRYQTPTREMSEWFTLDPKSLLDAEGK